MPTVDLNSDLGENVPARIVSDDEAMLRIVTSANISCGFHAGSPEGIATTLRAAVGHGVALGAHPSYRDYEGFGRAEVEIDSATLQAHVEYQLGAVRALAESAGGRISYVKPHGALYNAIVRDVSKAQAVVAAVRAFDPGLTLLALAGGIALEVADRAGLATAAEAFADRAYTPEGMLVPRREVGSVLHEPELVAARMVRLAQQGVIDAIDGTEIEIRAASICVHGDSPDAVAMAHSTRAALEAAGLSIAPFAP